MGEQNLVQDFPQEQKKFNLKEVLIPSLVIIAIIVAGGFTGYFLSKRGVASGPTETKELIGGAEVVQGPKEVGIKDEKAFRDTSQGKIQVNDNGDIPEGSHKLLRPGGESQTAYLTSSVLDLNQFLGKCVQVWGETFAAQKAGWLMDVGRVKILDSCPEGL
ncbi:hypothetical protein FJZ41_01470 [Candidatus Shapirobacteria bacterium]|nr:hypothetical protein [Candidatus Shapirobacteria bacterium]